MYAIRVSAERGTLEAEFSAIVSTEEALRAVSQAFLLAEAGAISRALCDVREVEAGLTHGNLPLIAASFTARLESAQRVAMLCTPEQLPLARHFARFARIGEELGVFTREDDATEWLSQAPTMQLCETVLRHMKAFRPAKQAQPSAPSRRNTA